MARDLSAIFGGRRSRPAKGTAVAIIPSRDGRSYRRWTLLLAGVVIALAAVATALLLGYGPSPPAMAPAGRAPAVKTRVAQFRPPMPNAAINLPAAVPSNAVADARSVAPPAADNAEKALSRPRAAVSATDSKVAAVLRDGRSVRRAATVKEGRTRARQGVARSARCGEVGSAERAWCLRPRVLAANRQLTQLYDQARRAGVDSRSLSRLRGQWASVQHKANSRPDEALTGYHNLRLDLLDLLEDQRANGRDD